MHAYLIKQNGVGVANLRFVVGRRSFIDSNARGGFPSIYEEVAKARATYIYNTAQQRPKKMKNTIKVNLNRIEPASNVPSSARLANRNEHLSKKAQKQLQLDGRMKPSDKPSKTIIKETNSRHAALAVKPEESASTLKSAGSGLSEYRLDAVVFVIVLAQIIAYVAIGFEIYVYSLDQYWNKVVRGEKAIEEDSHKIFAGKTFNFDGHDTLEKARSYLERSEPQELLFIIFIILFIIASTVQLVSCYIKTVDFEQYSAVLIGLYACGGALCIFCSVFLISGATNIENNYEYASDMLYNFQHIFDNSSTPPGPPLPPPTNCGENKEYIKGCGTFEYAKKQVASLEKIFRLCGDGSRYTRYYKTNRAPKEEVIIHQEKYLRSDLKELGFCSRDGYKFGAAIAAIIAGILCALVPVIYCCESKTSDQRRESYVSAYEALEQKRKSEEVKRKSEGTEALLPATDLPKKELYTNSLMEKERSNKRPSIDVDAALLHFRTYVEADSDAAHSVKSAVPRT